MKKRSSFSSLDAAADGMLRRMASGDNALTWLQARWGRIVGEPLSRKIEPTALLGRRLTVSYFEWVQDRAGFFWRESEVNERLEDIMVQSFRDVAQMAEKYGVSFRIAAYMLGISRVAHDTMVRGLYA